MGPRRTHRPRQRRPALPAPPPADPPPRLARATRPQRLPRAHPPDIHRPAAETPTTPPVPAHQQTTDMRQPSIGLWAADVRTGTRPTAALRDVDESVRCGR